MPFSRQLARHVNNVRLRRRSFSRRAKKVLSAAPSQHTHTHSAVRARALVVPLSRWRFTFVNLIERTVESVKRGNSNRIGASGIPSVGWGEWERLRGGVLRRVYLTVTAGALSVDVR